MPPSETPKTRRYFRGPLMLVAKLGDDDKARVIDFVRRLAKDPRGRVVGMDKDAELVELLLGLKQTDRPAYDAVILLLRRMVERKSQNQPLQS